MADIEKAPKRNSKKKPKDGEGAAPDSFETTDVTGASADSSTAGAGGSGIETDADSENFAHASLRDLVSKAGQAFDILNDEATTGADAVTQAEPEAAADSDDATVASASERLNDIQWSKETFGLEIDENEVNPLEALTRRLQETNREANKDSASETGRKAKKAKRGSRKGDLHAVSDDATSTDAAKESVSALAATAASLFDFDDEPARTSILSETASESVSETANESVSESANESVSESANETLSLDATAEADVDGEAIQERTEDDANAELAAVTSLDGETLEVEAGSFIDGNDFQAAAGDVESVEISEPIPEGKIVEASGEATIADVESFETRTHDRMDEPTVGEPESETEGESVIQADAQMDEPFEDPADNDADPEPLEFVEADQLISIIESLLFSTDKPVSVTTIKALFKNTNVRTKDITRAIDTLASEYASPQRGVTLEEINGGYQLRTKVDNSDFLKRLTKSRPFRLSGPALETMAIVAYKQPVTKHEIDEIRGVESGHLLRALMERGLVCFNGKAENLPGKPMSYGTTRKFLETFGLRNLKELPTLSEIDEILPEGIGDVEEKETLADLTDRMSTELTSTYSEGEDELTKINDQLKKIDTSTEFFEQEKQRERDRRDHERAQDIRERLVLGDAVDEKDKRWLDRFEAKLHAAQNPQPEGEGTRAAATDGEDTGEAFSRELEALSEDAAAAAAHSGALSEDEDMTGLDEAEAEFLEDVGDDDLTGDVDWNEEDQKKD